MLAAGEALIFWRCIARSLDRLVGCLAFLSADELNWRPDVPGANILAALAVHTLGNAEENRRQMLVGHPVERDREAECAVRDMSAQTVAARSRALRANSTLYGWIYQPMGSSTPPCILGAAS